MGEGEIWDEHRWEDFLSENDRRMDHRIEVFHNFLLHHPRPRDNDADALAKWRDVLLQYLAACGLAEDDVILRLFGISGDEPSLRWTEELGIDTSDEADGPILPPESVPVYSRALDYSLAVLDWANHLPVRAKDGTFVHFCASVTQIPGNIAKGHAIGYERESIGGNLACAKRGLRAANDALDSLHVLHECAVLDLDRYIDLYERLFEIRNDLGVYVQQLRERFELGID